MADESNMVPEEGKKEGRRDFVKTSAQVAVTAPAVAMLLKASVRPAGAVPSPSVAHVSHILDDFTFGNEREDIDAIETGNNFNFLDGKPQQDDHV
jgi:hypothetical protein